MSSSSQNLQMSYDIFTNKYLKYKLSSVLEVSYSQNHEVVPSHYVVQKPRALRQWQHPVLPVCISRSTVSVVR